MNNFNVSTTLREGERYEIQGLNVWNYLWKPTGEYISIKEPVRQQQLRIAVYEISCGEVKAKFAATEVSNGAYLICHEYSNG